MEPIKRLLRPSPPAGAAAVPFNIRQDLPWQPFQTATLHLDSRMLFETADQDGVVLQTFLDLASHLQKWEFFALSDLLLTFTFTGNAVRNAGFFSAYFVRDPALDGTSDLRNLPRFAGIKYFRYGNSAKVIVPTAELGFRCGAQEGDTPNRFESLGKLIIRPVDVPSPDVPAEARIRNGIKYSVSLSGTLFGRTKSILGNLITTYIQPSMPPAEYFDGATAELVHDDLTGAVSFKIRFFEPLSGYSAPWTLQTKTNLRFAFRAGSTEADAEDFDVCQSFMTATSESGVPTFVLPTQLASISDATWAIFGPATIVYDSTVTLWGYFSKTTLYEPAKAVNIGGRA